MKSITSFNSEIPAHFNWLNEPREYTVAGGLQITTDPQTDFWQRTHYGFLRDDGHCLLTEMAGDFQLTTCVTFQPQNRYDQCGLFVRIDESNWIKVSAEYIDSRHSELGAVVTNFGYSDWSTTSISSDIQRMCYRISRRGKDYLLQNSTDGEEWLQMRVTHLHAAQQTVQAGIYACSPKDGRFQCTFEQITIADNEWHYP